MAFKKRWNTKKSSRKKSAYSLAEKKAFKAGMAKQYNIEHPMFKFAVAEKHTTYNEDGSVYGKPYHGKVFFFKTEKEAKNYTTSVNQKNKLCNERVLKAVKDGKVGNDCTTSVAEYKRIKPMRDKGNLYSYTKL